MLEWRGQVYIKAVLIMPIYPTTDPPTGTAESFYNGQTMPSCPTMRDIKDWYMWTTLSGINASNYFAYTGTSPEIVAARQEKIDASRAHMMNLYHNFRKVKLDVKYTVEESGGGYSSWSYSGVSSTSGPISGSVDSEDVYGEGSTDPITESAVIDFLENEPYNITTWSYRYPGSTLFAFSDERPPNTRVPCPVGSLVISPGEFYEPLVNYFPFFDALYYDGIFLGYAVRYISSWDSGWLMTDCGRFTGTQGTVILGGSIQSDSTIGTSSNMERDLAYVDFPTSPSANAPKMICEATALGYESRSANAAGLTASGATVTGSGVTNEATTTIYNTGYGAGQNVWFWEYE